MTGISAGVPPLYSTLPGVRHQGPNGAADETLFEVCKREGRALITLDRDFGQVLRYPTAGGAGVIVIQVGHRVTHAALLERVRELLRALKT